jgi:hypothetical protein
VMGSDSSVAPPPTGTVPRMNDILIRPRTKDEIKVERPRLHNRKDAVDYNIFRASSPELAIEAICRLITVAMTTTLMSSFGSP